MQLGQDRGSAPTLGNQGRVLREDACFRELSLLVDQGLLHMSMSDEGEAVFWATERGAQTLGMLVN